MVPEDDCCEFHIHIIEGPTNLNYIRRVWSNDNHLELPLNS